MKNAWIYIALSMLSMLAAGDASAEEFLFCNNCTSSAQFESAAKSHATQRNQRGEWEYGVGNKLTGRFMLVHVSYTPAGEVPSFNSSSYNGEVIAANPILSSWVVAPPNPIEQDTRMSVAGTPIVHASSLNATWAQNAQFAAVVHVSDTRIIVNSPSGNDAFDSLSGAQMEQVGPYLYAAMTANNPAWVSNAIGSALKSALYKAIGWTQGKGPVGCIVFNNGDFGCFQLNIADANAAIYVKGTGKNAAGNAIDRTPNLPNGGGISTVVKPNITSGHTGYGIGGGSWWLFCATQGGKPIGCYVEYVQE